jgi:tRNA (guanine26-N2/guanine27-N2)-dimethyltransferase
MNNTSKVKLITEGKTQIFVYIKKITNKGPSTKGNYPFYNPSMELNRDISIALNQWFIDNTNKSKINLLDGLAASGIRGIRFSNELDGNFNVYINDWSEIAYKLIIKNIEKCKNENIIPSNKNLNTLINEKKFDYIDIDPFGSPIYFIDSAIINILRNGIIACTATDTATLCGVYPKVCIRRYGAMPFHSKYMHEIGLRILLGYIGREAAKYDKGIKPIISYSTDHYFRIYIQIINGIKKANKTLKHIYTINSKDYFYNINKNQKIGPLWMGEIGNKKIIKKIIPYIFLKQFKSKYELLKLLELLEKESNAKPFFYSSDKIASNLKKTTPKLDYIFKKLNQKGYYAIKTHFSEMGFKTDAPLNEIENIFIKKEKN